MPEYEVLNVGASSRLHDVNGFCWGLDIGCPSVNGHCEAVDAACPSINVVCDCELDSDCDDGGNVFPCENPGLGCRNGCGGASAMHCPEIMSIE